MQHHTILTLDHEDIEKALTQWVNQQTAERGREYKFEFRYTVKNKQRRLACVVTPLTLG